LDQNNIFNSVEIKGVSNTLNKKNQYKEKK